MGESAGIAADAPRSLCDGVRLAAGYGVGLALVGAWVAGSGGLAALYWRGLARASALRWQRPAEEAEPASVALFLHHLLAVGLLALLFRLFLERYRPLATDLNLGALHLRGAGRGPSSPMDCGKPGTFGGTPATVSALGGAEARRPVREALRRRDRILGRGRSRRGQDRLGMRSLVGLRRIADRRRLLLPARAGRIGAQASLLATVLIAWRPCAYLLEPLGVLHREVRVTVLGVFAVLAVLSMLWASGARGACKPRLGWGEGRNRWPLRRRHGNAGKREPLPNAGSRGVCRVGGGSPGAVCLAAGRWADRGRVTAEDTGQPVQKQSSCWRRQAPRCRGASASCSSTSAATSTCADRGCARLRVQPGPPSPAHTADDCRGPGDRGGPGACPHHAFP